MSSAQHALFLHHYMALQGLARPSFLFVKGEKKKDSFCEQAISFLKPYKRSGEKMCT